MAKIIIPYHHQLLTVQKKFRMVHLVNVDAQEKSPTHYLVLKTCMMKRLVHAMHILLTKLNSVSLCEHFFHYRCLSMLSLLHNNNNSNNAVAASVAFSAIAEEYNTQTHTHTYTYNYTHRETERERFPLRLLHQRLRGNQSFCERHILL